MNKFFKRLLVIILTACVLITGINIWSNHKGESASDLKFVFVHGLSGWGHYDAINTFFPYWGLTGGSITKYLGRMGYDCYEPSVAPSGSAWDRACELYAQLTGTVVDYGKEHSERCHHERYGVDYSKNPLMTDFENSQIVLIGHSFGGATIRLFSEILENGAESEIAGTEENDISPFFMGGNRNRIFAMVLLAAPSNGTTAYDMYEDPSFDVGSIEIPEEYVRAGETMSKGTKADLDTRIIEDYASYDMHIDNAYAFNEKITTFDDVFYFSYPCSTTKINDSGEKEPDAEITESMFMRSAILMSKYVGTTKGGIVIDETWQSNDGLVNEISAMAPSVAPFAIYEDGSEIVPGVYNVMPTVTGDHMYFQGGMTKHVKIKPFYLELVKMISSLQG